MTRCTPLAKAIVAFALLTLLTAPLLAQSPSPASISRASEKYVPENTVVALLPVVNDTKNKDPNMQARQNEKAQQELEMRFAEHGFKLADTATVTKAVSDLKVDLTDPKQRTPETLYQIGKAVNAPLVAFLVVADARSGSKYNPLSFGGLKKEGGATVKFWLVDAVADRPLLTEVTKSSKKGTSGFAPWWAASGTSGNSLSVRALGDAVSAASKDFFKPYPVVKKGAK